MNIERLMKDDEKKYDAYIDIEYEENEKNDADD
jgi:hypothetical protein